MFEIQVTDRAAPQKIFEREKRQGSKKTEKGLLLSSVSSRSSRFCIRRSMGGGLRRTLSAIATSSSSSSRRRVASSSSSHIITDSLFIRSLVSALAPHGGGRTTSSSSSSSFGGGGGEGGGDQMRRRLFSSSSINEEVVREEVSRRYQHQRQRIVQRRQHNNSSFNNKNRFMNRSGSTRTSSSLLTSQVRGYAFWSNNKNESPSSSSSATNELEDGTSSNSSGDEGGDSVSSIVTDLSSNTTLPPGTELVGEVAQIAGESWYTTAGLMYVMEYFHLVSGLEWYQAIAAATVVMRTLTLPFTVMQMRNTARMQLARPEMERLQERAKQTQAQNDPEAAQRHLSEVTAIWKKYECHPVKSLAPLLVSAPLFVSFYFAISRMADGIGSFKDGGAFWFTDLSAADPTMMMPLLTSALFLASVELGAVEGMNNNQQGLTMKWALRGLALALVPMTWNFTQGVFCYWITSNSYSLFQATLFKSTMMKRLAGIPDTSHLANLDSNLLNQKVNLDKIHEKWGEKPTLHSQRPPKKIKAGKRTYSSSGQQERHEEHVAVKYLPSNALFKERGDMF